MLIEFNKLDLQPISNPCPFLMPDHEGNIFCGFQSWMLQHAENCTKDPNECARISDPYSLTIPSTAQPLSLDTPGPQTADELKIAEKYL